MENRNSKSISIGLISQLLYELSLLAKNELLPTSQNFKYTHKLGNSRISSLPPSQAFWLLVSHSVKKIVRPISKSRFTVETMFDVSRMSNFG